MAVVSLNSNIASLKAQRQLERSSENQRLTFERLSSGQRINRASDDAAGLSVASTLSARSRVYTQAVRNANDGFSALNIAEGSATELTNVLIRLRELAIQSSNGTLSLSQRRSLDAEGKALTDEFNRAVASATFNGLRLYDPSASNLILQLGYGSTGTLSTGTGLGLIRKAGTLQFTSSSGASGPVVDDREVDTGDINGDGKLDYIDNSGVYLGNGDGTFSTVASTATGNLKLTDINGDGRLDLIASSGANFTIRTGNGDGTFAAGTTFANNSANDYELGDFNGDGRMEIVGRANTSLTVWLNNTQGSFSQASTISITAGTGTDIALGDVNGDGVLDVVVNNSTTLRHYSYLGSRTGTLTLATSSTAQVLDFDIQLADFNYDGILDLATCTGVRFGNGDGSFGSNNAMSIGGAQIEVADMNNDGFLDILGTDGDTVSVALSNGDRTFRTVQTAGGISMSSVGTGFYLGDFNGDSVLDIAAISDLANTSVYLSGTQQVTSIERLNLLTRNNALSALSYIDNAIARVSKELGNLGASQRRLEAALSHLQQTSLSYDQARARITDADMASESAKLINNSILMQSASAVLAQANQSPQIAIGLLRAI